MARERPNLGTPFGTAGPWLAAILDALGDLHDLLDARLPAQDSGPREDTEGAGPVRISEPAPSGPPPATVPVSEPVPAGPVEDDEPVEVSEPAPDPVPALPRPPARAGRGSSLEAWKAFADAAGVGYDPDASRDDVIAACERAQVIEGR